MDSLGIENIRNVKDFEYSIQVTRWLLQPIGVWPLKSPRNPLILRLIANVICLSNLLFFFIPCILYIFIVVQTFGGRVQIFGPVAYGFLSIFKYITLLIKKDKLNSCIIDMATDWHETNNEEDRYIMLKNSKIARLFTIVSLIFMILSGAPFNIIIPLIKKPIIIANITYRHLTYPAYFGFFNPNVNPAYKYVFLSHCLTGIVMYTLTSGVCGIIATCILHISSRCAVISLMFQRLANNFDSDLLANIVKEHWRSLKFASKLEDILNEICLVEFVGSSINICLVGYYFLSILKYNDVIALIMCSFFFFSITFNIFVYCYIGHLLTEECESIGTAAYMMNWYRFPPKDVRNLVVIIALTQRPVFLTAGKVVNLSIPTFSNIMKASATYLNMLRTITMT